MKNKPYNPPAFPVAIDREDFNEGMDLRDYFAAKALQSEMINPNGYGFSNDTSIRLGVEHCYKIADTMLAHREHTVQSSKEELPTPEQDKEIQKFLTSKGVNVDLFISWSGYATVEALFKELLERVEEFKSDWQP